MKRLLIFLLSVVLLLFCGCVKPTDTPLADQPTTDGENTAPEQGGKEEGDEAAEEVTVMYITVNGNKLEVTLENNPAVTALIEILKQGDINYAAIQNGFEIYGNIGHTLPADDERMTAQAGDVLLYVGNTVCIFFGSNNWEYTRIGKIEGYSAAELKSILGGSTVDVTISLK